MRGAELHCSLHTQRSNSHSYLTLAQLSEELMSLMLIWDTDVNNKINTNNSDYFVLSSSPVSADCFVVFVCQELVRLAAERQHSPSPLSPVQSQPVVGQTGGCDELQITDRTSTCSSPGQEEEETVSAPPKPPMPFSEPQVTSPPGLR